MENKPKKESAAKITTTPPKSTKRKTGKNDIAEQENPSPYSLEELREMQTRGKRKRFKPVKGDPDALEAYQKELKSAKTGEPNFESLQSLAINNARKRFRRNRYETFPVGQVKIMFHNVLTEIVQAEFQVDQKIKPVYNDFCRYLANDRTGRLDPDKGLFIFGQAGTGKTTMVEAGAVVLSALKRLEGSRDPYIVKRLDDYFVKGYSDNSLAWIQEFTKGEQAIDDIRFNHFDFRYYGETFNPVPDIIAVRYNEWQRFGTRTIITTNLFPEQFIKRLADERLAERVREMFNLFPVNAENKRTDWLTKK